MTPDWQLPPGVDRGLLDYMNNAELARGYDEALADTPLLEIDAQFAQRWFDKPGRVLDLGCGTGRLMVPFAHGGYQYVGVDYSPQMLALAIERAKRMGGMVCVVRENLVEMDSHQFGPYDYAACLFSTFGMIRGRDNRQRMLGHVRRLLKPGGRFVLHAHNRWFHSWNPFASGDRTAPQHHGGAPLTLHHFTRREIVRDLREAGFRILQVEPVSTRADGILPRRWLFPGLRAYGYLIAAE